MPLVFPQQKYHNEVKTLSVGTSNNKREGSKTVDNPYFPGVVLALTQWLISIIVTKYPEAKTIFRMNYIRQFFPKIFKKALLIFIFLKTFAKGTHFLPSLPQTPVASSIFSCQNTP